MTLDKYAEAHIFQPLGMKNTHFLGSVANHDVFDALARGDDPRNIAQSWQDGLQKS